MKLGRLLSTVLATALVSAAAVALTGGAQSAKKEAFTEVVPARAVAAVGAYDAPGLKPAPKSKPWSFKSVPGLVKLGAVLGGVAGAVIVVVLWGPLVGPVGFLAGCVLGVAWGTVVDKPGRDNRQEMITHEEWRDLNFSQEARR